MSAESIELILQAKDQISAIVQEVKKNIETLPSSINKAQGSVGGFNSTMAGLKVAIGAVAAGLAALGIIQFAKSVVDETEKLGTQVRTLTRETGMSAEAASELIAVADDVGVSFEALQGGIVAVSRRLGALKEIQNVTVDASGKMIDVFEKFDITIKNTDGTLKPFPEIFQQIRQRIQDTSSETERMAIATQFFRGHAAELMPLLTMTAGQYKELAAEAQKYGLILTGQNVAQIYEYTRAHRELNDSMQGLKVAIGLEVMPTLIEWAKVVTENRSQLKEYASIIGTVVSNAFYLISGVFKTVVAAGYEVAAVFATITAGILRLSGNIDASNVAWQAAKNFQQAAIDTAKGAVEAFGKMGIAAEGAGKKAVDSATKQMTAAEKLRLANEAYVNSWELALKNSELELKTKEAQINLNVALEQKLYQEGKQGLDDYMAHVKAMWADYNKDREEQLKSEILLVREKIKDHLMSEEEGNKEIKAKEEELKQFDIKMKEDDLKRQEDYHKEALAQIENFAKLKVDALKAANELEAANDEVALQKGEMRQSEFLQRKLDRAKAEMEAEVAVLQEKADKEAALAGTGSLLYQQITSQKEQIQLKYQALAIKSEQEITAAVTKEEETQVEVVRKCKEKSMAVFNDLMDAIADRRKRLTESVSSLMTTGWDDVKKYFGDWKKATGLTVDDVQLQINNFMKNTTFATYDTFWNASLYGRKLVDMVGTSIFEWSSRVAEYVNYVKGLMQSLRDLISSYQDQLDQLKGNEAAILDRWYQKELDSLKDKYAKDLMNTAEYQQALTLLNELYAEKRKKIMEDEAKAHDDYMNKMVGDTGSQDAAKQGGAGGSVGGNDVGGSGAGASIPPPLKNFGDLLTARIVGQIQSVSEAAKKAADVLPKDINIKREVVISPSFDMPSLDKDGTGKWFSDQFMPLFLKEMALRGVKL
jgi:hypothetical protein